MTIRRFGPEEFAIGGYKPSASNFDSILVGYFEKRKLYFAGKVRAGFTPHMRAEVMRRIADRPITRCPFVNLPNSTGKSHWGEGMTADDMKALRWVRPTVVVEFGFVEWTADTGSRMLDLDFNLSSWRHWADPVILLQQAQPQHRSAKHPETLFRK